MTIIKKFDPQDYNNKFPKKYVFLAVVILLSLALIEVWISNALATFGKKFDEMTQLEQTLEMDNQILENSIAKDASLKSIATESSELGFFKPENIQYIR